MAEAVWEAWVLWWLAGFQFLVAFWWWRAAPLEGTRGLVAALFATNGIATGLAGVVRFSDVAAVAFLGDAVDRWTNPLLLGVGLVAIGLQRRSRGAFYGCLALGALAIVAAMPGTVAQHFGDGADAPWGAAISEAPMLGGFSLMALTALHRARLGHSTHGDAWMMALAFLLMRGADLAVTSLPGVFERGLGGPAWEVAWMSARLITFAACVSAFGALLHGWWRTTPGPARQDVELAAAVVLAGFIWGAAEVTQSVRGSPPVPAILYFTLGFARPLGFTFVIARANGTPLWASPEGVVIQHRGLQFSVSLAAVVVGLLLGMDSGGALALGVAALVLTLPLASRVFPAWRQPPPTAVHAPSDRSDRWPLEHDKVPLPPDWRERLEQSYGVFLRLGPATQQRLGSLARWKRLMLALDAVPPDAARTAYERSTPGLHLATHCPYASIGSEIARLNSRYKMVLEELGIPLPSTPVNPTAALILSDWGRADGLRSGRVKSYELTHLGRAVARRLREELELADRPVAEVAKVIGEGFPRHLEIEGRRL